MFGNRKLKQRIAELEAENATIKASTDEISIRDSQAFAEMFLGGPVTTTSVRSVDAAMRCSAVFACVRLLSGALASAPVRVYQRRGGSRMEMPKHPFLRMLSLRPNEFMTASTFWKCMTIQKVLEGNAYAAILRANPTGRAVGLYPFRASRVEPYQAWELGLDKKLGVSPYRLYYAVSWDEGRTSLIDQDDMLHIPNLNFNGKKGMSTISAGAQAMGLALSAESSAAKIFENGMVSQIALEYPEMLKADAQEELRRYISDHYSGASNHHKPLILTRGGKANKLSLNAEDAQLIESRQFSVIDIARFFGIPPILIGESEKTSSWGSGVEQVLRWFVMGTLNDHFTDFEQELAVKLFNNSDATPEFDESELTRGDTKTRAEYFKAALGGTQNPGWLTQNDVRKAEGYEPMTDGDTLHAPQEKANAQEQTAATV